MRKVVLFVIGLFVFSFIIGGISTSNALSQAVNPYGQSMQSSTKTKIDNFISTLKDKGSDMSESDYTEFLTRLEDKLQSLETKYSSNAVIVDLIQYIGFEISEMKSDNSLNTFFCELTGSCSSSTSSSTTSSSTSSSSSSSSTSSSSSSSTSSSGGGSSSTSSGGANVIGKCDYRSVDSCLSGTPNAGTNNTEFDTDRFEAWYCNGSTGTGPKCNRSKNMSGLPGLCCNETKGYPSYSIFGQGNNNISQEDNCLRLDGSVWLTNGEHCGMKRAPINSSSSGSTETVSKESIMRQYYECLNSRGGNVGGCGRTRLISEQLLASSSGGSPKTSRAFPNGRTTPNVSQKELKERVASEKYKETHKGPERYWLAHETQKYGTQRGVVVTDEIGIDGIAYSRYGMGMCQRTINGKIYADLKITNNGDGVQTIGLGDKWTCIPMVFGYEGMPDNLDLPEGVPYHHMGSTARQHFWETTGVDYNLHYDENYDKADAAYRKRCEFLADSWYGGTVIYSKAKTYEEGGIKLRQYLHTFPSYYWANHRSDPDVECNPKEDLRTCDMGHAQFAVMGRCVINAYGWKNLGQY